MIERDVLSRSRDSTFFSPAVIERDASLIAPEMMTMMMTSIEMEIMSSSSVNPRRERKESICGVALRPVHSDVLPSTPPRSRACAPCT